MNKNYLTVADTLGTGYGASFRKPASPISQRSQQPSSDDEESDPDMMHY